MRGRSCCGLGGEREKNSVVAGAFIKDERVEVKVL